MGCFSPLFLCLFLSKVCFFNIDFKAIYVRFKALSPVWNMTTPFFRDNATVEFFLRTNFSFFLNFYLT